jgi:hypothetical protein
MTQKSPFRLPTVTCNSEGRPRKVGFELEFTGLDLEQTTAIVERVFSSRHSSKSQADAVVEVAELGTFTIELDWHYLKQKATQKKDQAPHGWLDLLSQAATLLVPMEVVCPPIAMTQLAVLDPLLEELRQAGAMGTEDSVIAAYGVHINAEVPRLDAATLDNFLRAFSLLQWWLVDAHQVDVARRISPYVDLYPENYLKLLFSRHQPDLDTLLQDYLRHNATRNRALDLLPLLAQVAAGQVQRAVPDTKIKARPAFHYRLPNCQIDKPDWSLADAWNTWWVVEELARRPDDLDDLCMQFLSMDRPLIGVSRNNWTGLIDRWLQDHRLA